MDSSASGGTPFPTFVPLVAIGNPLKKALEQAYPDAKPGAIPVWAGILLRFAYEMKEGDIVIAPYRADSTLNFGVITGDYEFFR